ncbi:MAG TPA: type II toxin-antitoxin system PrlF family antitoxin [Terriglobia bacterium]|nr:type II toxin-antitoxin system PrlF family antitoxin [Terriglobia bacterium]
MQSRRRAFNRRRDRKLRSGRDYERALAKVEELRGAKAGTPKGDCLDILATLIEAYETEHYPMDPPDPIEAIKFRMEQQGLTRKDWKRSWALGSVNRSAVMNAESTLTSKGQTTIPKDIRDRLRMKTGDRMTFTLMPDGTVLMPA